MIKKIIGLVVFAQCAFVLSAEIRYVEINAVKNAPLIELNRIEDVQLIIREFDVGLGYLQKDPANAENCRLLLIADGTYFSFNIKGYTSISDYLAGVKSEFKNGFDYYEAKQLALDSSDLYYFYKQNSFRSVADCKNAFKTGFDASEFKTRDGSYQNGAASRAYYDAQNRGAVSYEDFKELVQIQNQGFKTREDFRTATKRGFSNGQAYYDATEKGFASNDDYVAANAVSLSTHDEYLAYKAVVDKIDDIMKSQKLDKKNSFIYFYLQKIPKGQQSLAVLVKSMTDIYKTEDETIRNALDMYFTDTTKNSSSNSNNRHGYSSNSYKGAVQRLFTDSDLLGFFNTVNIGKIGKYDAESGIFTRK